MNRVDYDAEVRRLTAWLERNCTAGALAEMLAVRTLTPALLDGLNRECMRAAALTLKADLRSAEMLAALRRQERGRRRKSSAATRRLRRAFAEAARELT